MTDIERRMSDKVCDLCEDDETRKIMLYGVTTYSDVKEKPKICEQVWEKIMMQKPDRAKVTISHKRKIIKHKACYNCC